MAQDKSAVKHFNTTDIMLNTAKMRDAIWIQTLTQTSPSHTDAELDTAIYQACSESLSGLSTS